MVEYLVKTTKYKEFVDITSIVHEAIRKADVKDGIVIVFVPHTTAGVTINENADPDVVTDIISGLNKAFGGGQLLAQEGNSHAHIKASLMGSSCSIIVENGRLKLGTWQEFTFANLMGQERKVYLKIIHTNPEIGRMVIVITNKTLENINSAGAIENEGVTKSV